MAPQKQLESTGIIRKSDSNSQIVTPSPTVVVTGGQSPIRPTITPNQTCSADLYRRIKRRVGRSLKQTHCKRVLVHARKQTTHKLSGTKSSFSCPQRVQRSLYRPDSTGGNRQHYRCLLHKQGGRHEVGPTLCPSLENPDLVHQTPSNTQSPTHPRPIKCSSRQTIPPGSDHSNRMVPSSRGFSGNMLQVAPAQHRSICHEVQQQTTSICVACTRSPSHCGGRPQSTLGGSGRLCLPTNSHTGQSVGEVTGFSLQENHSDCSRVAQHALVLGSSSHVQPDPSQFTQPADTAVQSDPSQKSHKPESPCMAPRATAIKEQGFSEAVATRIEAPQRRSTRSVYEAKWTVFTKWCNTNQVDFRAPPVKSVADFLMYLFEDRKLQPSTIDGYRSAIADKLGNLPFNISRDENLTRLLDSFHRDRPKGRRGIPSWNLSLVLHQLTKAPFEPIREASLKHLTFKTVFLLALGSGKRRSEIPTTIKKEAPTGNAPMGAIPPKAVINCFPQVGGNQTTEASEMVFDPILGDEGMKTPPPNDSLQASLSPPVGGRLHSFRQDWQTNKCSDNVLDIITNDYVLLFISKPNLVRAPLIQSGYKALQKDQALASCIQSHLSKNAIERVENVKSLGCYSRLFLVPKPHQRWRPVIDLSRLNTFLLVERFKKVTPESIRTSLIPGEWVSSIDLSDAYLHIPIHPNSRKYLRFCHKSQVFQFTLLFRLATAPQVFTMIGKDVKLMALTRGIRLHQYLDDWLIRAQSQEEAQVN